MSRATKVEARFSLIKSMSLIVGAILAAAALIIAGMVMAPGKADQANKKEYAALKVLMPSADSFSERSAGGIGYFEAKNGGEPIGYCVRVTARGYSGDIKMIVGVDTKGVIGRIEVLEHSETYGMGGRIAEVRPGEKEPWFLRQFAGKSAAGISAGDGIDAITGATVSSKAITDAVSRDISAFMEKMR
jgi:electron transport complex protein RnfG